MSIRDNVDFSENCLFSGVDPDIRKALNRIPEVVAFGPDEVIFDEDAVDDHVYLIGDGVVRISKQGRGEQHETLSYLEGGDFFGEMAAFDPAPRSARAQAVSEVILGRISRAGLAEVLRLAPLPISENLSRRAIQRLRATDSHLIRELLEAERLSLVGSMAGSIIHDLKNPIGVIRSATDLLELGAMNPDHLRWVKMIQRSASRMLDMVQELLDYSSGNASLAVSEVSVDDVLAELDEQILHGASRSGIVVETIVSAHCSIRIDRTRFLRVLVNIIKNAMEAMPGGGVLTVEIEAAEGEVRFSISDTGQGIPEHLLSRIFEPFVTHGKANGTGLGMAIAKSVVDAHGGRIVVSSRAGEGTRFDVILPGATGRRDLPGGT